MEQVNTSEFLDPYRRGFVVLRLRSPLVSSSIKVRVFNHEAMVDIRETMLRPRAAIVEEVLGTSWKLRHDHIHWRSS